MDSETNGKTTPDAWLLLSDKLGDNAQVEIVLKELGWSLPRKDLVFLEEYRFGKPNFKASLYHVDLEQSSPLQAPWPRFVITTGRRCAMVAQWIREQSNGHTEVILFGRPKKNPKDYALIVAPGQYALPKLPNVYSFDLPLMRVDPAKLEAGRREWASHFEGRGPVIGVLVGGPTKPFAMPVSFARELVEVSLKAAERENGSLFVTTSRRTPKKVIEILRSEFGDKAEIHVFGEGDRNPYFGLLAWGEKFFVTGDSVSMMVEVARLGKPLSICELPLAPGFRAKAHETSLGLLHRPNAPFKPLISLIQSAGLMGYPRDLRAIHRALYAAQAAVPMGRGFLDNSAMIADEVVAVAERLRNLVEPANGSELTNRIEDEE